jgi:hypothetical protein
MELVNGYQCRDCTDVAYAKRNIDPQHPKDGPFGVNRAEASSHGPAVVLDGKLAPAGPASSVNDVAAVDPARPSGAATGARRVDLRV